METIQLQPSLKRRLRTKMEANERREQAMSSQEAAWNACIQLNNLGLDHLLQGRLHNAQHAFLEASQLHHFATKFQYAFDSDSRVYQNNWVNLQSTVNCIATDISNHNTTSEEHVVRSHMQNMFLFGLRIGRQVDDDDEDERMMNNGDDDNSAAITTTRIDWCIHYNLGLVTQFMGIIRRTDECGKLDYRVAAFDRYEKIAMDVEAWFEGMAPLDAAILMMALHNNQGSICRQLQLCDHVKVHWGRMQSIMNASKSLRKHNICHTFLDNLELLIQDTRPAAAA
eukprot:scaffold1027_cov108-Cylindrotheca_fusiformis.AAC.4